MRFNYLEQLGIPVWQLNAKPAVSLYQELRDATLQRKGVVVFDSLPTESPPFAWQALLTAMLAAIGYQCGAVLAKDEVEQSELPVLVFGTVSRERLLLPVRSVVTHHPRDVLADSARKRKVWQDLQRFKTL